MNKICQYKEGIVFAFHEEKDGEVSYTDEGTGEKQNISAFETYAKEKLKDPAYRRILISLERLNRQFFMIENSWQRVNRNHSQKELENMLIRQHEIELEIEGIEDVFLSEYIYEQLDNVSAARRSLAQDIRWDIESAKNHKEMP